MDNITINEIKYSLVLKGKIPLHTPYSMYTSHTRYQPLLGSETLRDLGAGSLTHFHFQTHLLGGAGKQTFSSTLFYFTYKCPMQKVVQVNHTAQLQPPQRSLIPQTQHMHLAHIRKVRSELSKRHASAQKLKSSRALSCQHL